jgi:hypothetical protein
MPPHAHRIARRTFAATAPLLAVFSLAAIQPAAGSPGREEPLPPQGLYEGCAPGSGGETCVQRLVTIRAAGFRYVLNYSSWYGSPAEVLRYADAAAALGLQLIWPLNHPAWRGLTSLDATYTTLGETGAFSTSGAAARSDAELLDGAIALAADHPATWGFYIGDELPRAEVSRVAALGAAVRELAPDKPQLYIARPGVERLSPFAGLVDVAGVDTYPVGSADPPVRRAARSAHAVASAAGAQTGMVLQTFSWSQYRPGSPPRYPGSRSLLAMRDAAIRHTNPAMILWYSYQDILRSDAPKQRWRNLTHAAFAPVTPSGS